MTDQQEKDEAGRAMFRLATGTSSYELDRKRVLKYLGFDFPEIPLNFQRALDGLVAGLRAAVLFGGVKEP